MQYKSKPRGKKLKSVIRSKGVFFVGFLASFFLSIGLLILADSMLTAKNDNSLEGNMTEATTFAQDKVEQLRASPWGNITSGADIRTGSTGIVYSRNWNVTNNSMGNQRWVTVTIDWNDGINHSINLLSVIPQ
jgi:hypothetical protein